MTELKENVSTRSKVKSNSANKNDMQLKANRKHSNVEATPFPGRMLPTSTPANVAVRIKTRGNRFNICVACACRTPLSPIVMDADSVRYAENRNPLFSNKPDVVQQKKSLTKRRTFGSRRLFSLPDDTGKNNRTWENVKVRLQRNPSKSDVQESDGVCEDKHSKEVSLQENTLVKNLRNDWSSTTLEDSFPKPSRPSLANSSNSSLPKPSKSSVELRKKRILGPLIGTIVEESTVVGENTNREKVDETGNYSSSAEFESDEEKDDSHLKKAPTWRSLHKETNDSKNISASTFSLRRSRRRFVGDDSQVVTEKDRAASNNSPEEERGSVSIGRNAKSQEKSYKESGRKKNVFLEESVQTATNNRKKDEIKGDDAEISRTVALAGIKLPRLRLRRAKICLKRDGSLASENPATDGKRQGANKCHSDRSSRANTPPGIKQPKVRLQRAKLCSTSAKLDSAQKQAKPTVETISDENSNNICELNPCGSQDPKPAEREDEEIQNFIDENFPSLPSSIKSETSNSGAIEPLPMSPVYEDLDENVTSISSCPSKKFFASRIHATPAVSQSAITTKPRSSRKRKKKEDNIYDFFSQSSTEETDPMADIIQKMISTGKVFVAKHKKNAGKGKKQEGTGRNKKNNAAKNNKVGGTKRGKIVRPKKNEKPQPPATQKQQQTAVTVNEDDYDTHFDDAADHFENADPSHEQASYSGLARSTMINQAKRIGQTPPRRMITDRKKLLELAQKFVGQSTPVKPNTETVGNVSQFSPITGNKSPWRADDDNLPTTFYFGRNSDNLPSYSSDHITTSQPEPKPKSVSSLSSNDSDMENIAPSGQPENTPVVARRDPNRSPLKSIDIIDVVNLPPLVLDNSKAKDVSKAINQSAPSRSINKSLDRSNQTVQNEARAADKTNPEEPCADKTDLFGFEDIIEGETDSGEASVNLTALPTKVNLKEKLKQLKRLRPEIPSTSSSKPEPVKSLFNEPRTRQKSVREMLCSTMIAKPRSTGQEERKEQRHELFDDGWDADLSNLFKDPEPETTFNESDTRRTYSRLYKTKKRKVRNNFVMFLDSDASDDEEEEERHKKRPTKRQKIERKANEEELNKFVDEFNEMCQEVSQYQLVVE